MHHGQRYIIYLISLELVSAEEIEIYVIFLYIKLELI